MRLRAAYRTSVVSYQMQKVSRTTCTLHLACLSATALLEGTEEEWKSDLQMHGQLNDGNAGRRSRV